MFAREISRTMHRPRLSSPVEIKRLSVLPAFGHEIKELVLTQSSGSTATLKDLHLSKQMPDRSL